MTQVDLQLQEGLQAASQARRSLDDLAPHMQPDVLENVRFLVNELVTNSIRHVGGEVRLRVEARTETIRVEVIDRGEGFTPRAVSPDPDQTSGRGLFLVDQMADRWGVEGNGGTKVWFEVDCSNN